MAGRIRKRTSLADTSIMTIETSSAPLHRTAVAGPGSEAAVAREAADLPRHLAIIRVAHWLIAAAVIGLIVTGIYILIAHPRLYWGETGAVGTDSLIDLPIPFIIGYSPSNRPIHFFFAWILVLSALTYVVAGFRSGHFRKNLVPSRSDLSWNSFAGVVAAHLRWRRIGSNESWTYNVVQRLTYLAVVFVLFPAILWTGLAMSPAVTSVFPFLATSLGGYQSARTLHFFCASLLLLFVVVHIAMLVLVGFTRHTRAMITGGVPERKSRP